MDRCCVHPSRLPLLPTLTISAITAMELKVENVLHMNGGHGERSYAQNSWYQEKCLRFLQPFLHECISNMKIIPCETFCIADLGCSSGPNTLFVAETISKAIQDKYMGTAFPIPEMQVFFSDLPSNDFNLLLGSLPPPPNPEEEEQDNTAKIKRCNYFAAAVAGSFYRRLFPANTLHFIHSSFSLHWLSQIFINNRFQYNYLQLKWIYCQLVPAEIEDKMCRSWNRGRVFISKEGPAEVGEAYLSQFQKDFNSFLRARSQEVVAGGCIFFCLVGRPDACHDPRDQGPTATMWDILEDAFNDIILQGVIEEEKRDSFNFPFFSPSPKEMRMEVKKEGSFVVKEIEFLSTRGYFTQFNMEIKNNEILAMIVGNQSRAVLEGLISTYFGGEVVNPLYENFAQRAANKIPELLNSLRDGGEFFVVLERT